MVRSMRFSQYSVRAVNGKVVYLFKITDQLKSEINTLSDGFKKVHSTFSRWQEEHKVFSNSVKCSEGKTMEFLSK